jgi:hypothetical protein
MLSIRRTWWAALALAAMAGGCTTEEPTNPSATPPPAPAAVPGPEAPTAIAPAPETKPMPGAEPIKDAPAATPEKSEAPPIEAPKPEPAAKGDQPKAAAAAVKLSDEEVAEIKTLPADQQTLALKQAVCPVSDEHLGSMGAPIKVTAAGKDFFICCKSCKKEVDADPSAVLAKLGGK